MKRCFLVGLMSFAACGCTGMNNTQQGALTGGVIGTGAGALVGHATGNTGLGMLIGGLFGTGVGAAVGNEEDRREDRRAAREIAWANAKAARQIPLHEIVQMTQQKVADEVIINHIRTTGSNYDLRTDDILFLRQQGVSDRVIAEMQVRRAPHAVVVDPAPVYVRHPRHVYIYEPPPPPPYVGVGFHFRR